MYTSKPGSPHGGPTVASGAPDALASTRSEAFVDVTDAASDVFFGRTVELDLDTFATAVTRRPAATVSDLSDYERTRLIDLVLHAAKARHMRDGAFNVWMVPSESITPKARSVWFELKEVNGRFQITLSDI